MPPHCFYKMLFTGILERITRRAAIQFDDKAVKKMKQFFKQNTSGLAYTMTTMCLVFCLYPASAWGYGMNYDDQMNLEKRRHSEGKSITWTMANMKFVKRGQQAGWTSHAWKQAPAHSLAYMGGLSFRIAEPVPFPKPEDDPYPIPEPSRDPIPNPIPSPDPEPFPDPIPAPEPDPNPDPDPVPTPDPNPGPDPEPILD